MHPGGKITSNYARVEKKARANSGPPGSRESPLEKKTDRKMEGKSDPPEERRIAHEKKERSNGRNIPAPRGAENPTRRKNFVSGTPISSTCVPSRQHTQQDDARFQPHARTHQRKKGRLRPQKRWRLHPKTKSTATSAELCPCCFFFSARIRPSQGTHRSGRTPRQRTPGNNNFVRFPAQTGARFVRRPHVEETILFTLKQKNPLTLPTFSFVEK